MSSADSTSPDPSLDRTAPAELPATAVRTERPGPRGGRRDTNRRERVKALTDGAVKLFLASGIESTTIDDIAKEAGVAKGSFYRYFESKDELVAFVFAPVVHAVEDAFAEAATGIGKASTHDEMMRVYQDLGAALGAVMLAHDEVVLLYLQENRAPGKGARRPVRALADFITERALFLTQIAHERALFRPFPYGVSALTVVGASERIIFGLLTSETAIDDPMAVPGALASLVLDGIAADSVRGRVGDG